MVICPMNLKEPIQSAYSSKTEEVVSDDEEDLEEHDEKIEDMEAEEENGDHCQCPKSLILLPPLRLSMLVCTFFWTNFLNFSRSFSTSYLFEKGFEQFQNDYPIVAP